MDRERIAATIRLIDSSVLTQKVEQGDQKGQDTTADYRAHLAQVLADLDVLIEQYEAGRPDAPKS